MSVLGALRVMVLVLLAFAVAGALAGVVWVWVWTPPSGVVIDGRWVHDPVGLSQDFAGTGWYVVVAAVAGLLTALAVSWWSRHELVTLGATVLGAVLAGWVMFQVGHALGPEDPQVLAQGRVDLTALPGELEVAGAEDGPPLPRPGSSAFVAFPAGALAALAAVFLTTDRRGRHARRPRLG